MKTSLVAKPILKWAGGKTQLLSVLSQHYPKQLGSEITTYIEPFFGGGAVFFDLYSKRLMQEAIILDANRDLILLYKTIQKKPHNIIEKLEQLQKKYFSFNDCKKEKFYYEIREAFNLDRNKIFKLNINVERASFILFLNRLCFNGLFRVNRSGEFNVPYGKHKNPKILNSENLEAVSQALQIAEIRQGDFEEVIKLSSKKNFIYYDPPYKPVSKTSIFNSYTGLFSDTDQTRLASVFKELDKKGVSQMLSNSDPFQLTGDNFFDELYAGFYISRIEARRMINSNAKERGKIFEILIKNYT